MKWINGYTWEEKKNRKERWHKWFAWFPVCIGLTSDNRQIKVWLQYAERKGEFFYVFPGESGWSYKYREGEPK